MIHVKMAEKNKEKSRNIHRNCHGGVVQSKRVPEEGDKKRGEGGEGTEEMSKNASKQLTPGKSI